MIVSHNNYSDIFASELEMILRNDLYMRSVDLKNNNVGEFHVAELIKVLDTNISLTNIDLRENPGFTNKHHR
jgi:hypothetical protein